jgi:hypothetical protein
VPEGDGVGLVLEGDGDAVDGGGAGAGWSTVFSILLGVTKACNGIVPSLTTSVRGTAAVVKVT